jgi:hypothetical protein
MVGKKQGSKAALREEGEMKPGVILPGSLLRLIP